MSSRRDFTVNRRRTILYHAVRFNYVKEQLPMIRYRLLLAFTMALCLLGAPKLIFAAHPEIPRISIEELKKLLDGKAELLIIDAQPRAIYEQGHIPGAISFPWREEVTITDIARFPKDKLIVFYCDSGPGESDSANLAYQFQCFGFTQVKVLAHPSIRGWKRLGYPLSGRMP